MSTSPYTELFAALDVVAFLRSGPGSFTQPIPAPDWWQRLYPDHSGGGETNPGHACPFLDNFLVDAEQFWAVGQIGKIESGIWYEDDPHGGQLRLEATATISGAAHYLLIKRADDDGRQSLLQKARESQLKHLMTLAAKEQEEELLRQASELLERMVAERTAELNAANAAMQREVEERTRAEAIAREALAENEILIKEIHHRVKNNLQVLSSLIDLQSQRLEDPQALRAFDDNRNRIFTLSLIHENLYANQQLSRIALGTYVHELAQSLCETYAAEVPGVELRLELDDLHLGIDAAMPCGLIVNELVSNAYKHAFADGRGGAIGVTLTQTGEGEVLLRVWDEGPGLPPEADLQQPTTLGLQLVKTLTAQLGGTIALDSDGARFELRFRERTRD